MPLPTAIRASLRTWRSVFGSKTRIENWARRRYLERMATEIKTERGPGWVQKSGKSWVVVSESEDFPEPRRGVLLKGGCDLPSAFTAAPLLREGIEGTIAISRHIAGTGGNRSDQILQTLEKLDPAAIAETIEILQLNKDYFEPSFFDPTFQIPRMSQLGDFPKKVVIMGIATDEVRQMYRHRQHGFIVDPGGWWLNQDLSRVLSDIDKVQWLRTNFERIGRLTLEEFLENNTRLIGEIRERIGAHVVYYNTLTVDPGRPTHTYQLENTSLSARRRDFTVALAELSARLDVSIVDVDRILKTKGVEEQVDFAHFPVDRMMPIGAELHRILKTLNI